MLVTMHENGPLLSDARADTICAFDLFGPHCSNPDAPILELIGQCFITAVVNSAKVYFIQITLFYTVSSGDLTVATPSVLPNKTT